jgi:translation elongation factor EF-G
MTQGRASFKMKFADYATVTPALQKELTQKLSEEPVEA